MLRVGLIQLRTPADQAAALAQAEPLVREAASKGAQLIATPEGTNILSATRPGCSRPWRRRTRMWR